MPHPSSKNASTGSRPAPIRSEINQVAHVRRKPERASYDREAIYFVLDAAPFSHVATIRNGRPVVLPMAHGRRGQTLFLHGSAAAGLFRDLRKGSPVCVTATLFDGLVLGRSARNHSMNYRSATIHGVAERVTEQDEVIAGLRAIVDHLLPGRWNDVREPTTEEILETGLWAVDISDASAKARSGSTIDPEYDLDIPVWAGHIPAELTFGSPIPADQLPPDAVLPEYVDALIRKLPNQLEADDGGPNLSTGNSTCATDSPRSHGSMCWRAGRG